MATVIASLTDEFTLAGDAEVTRCHEHRTLDCLLWIFSCHFLLVICASVQYVRSS